MSGNLRVDVDSISKTGRVDDGLDVLEVSLMVQVSKNGSRTFTGWAYSDRVELKCDPSDANLHPDDLRDLMAGAAHNWSKQFEDWETEIRQYEEPVGGDN